jgi:hypothetical protein
VAIGASWAMAVRSAALPEVHPATRAMTIPISYGRSKRPWYRMPLLVSAAVIASAAGSTSSSIQFHSFWLLKPVQLIGTRYPAITNPVKATMNTP